MQRNFCPNRNHSRSNAPVRCCPQCGEAVNGNIPPKECSEELHAKRRRERNKFCVDCGTQLIK
jgi:rRNA maturation protein Nop10